MRKQVKGMLNYNNQLNSEMKSNKKIRVRKFKIRIANSHILSYRRRVLQHCHVLRIIIQP